MKQIRQRTPEKSRGGEFVVACPTMKSNCNISMLIRSASCFGATKVIITGNNKVNDQIARDYDIPVEHRNSLLPVITKHKKEGFKIIGLEQTTESNSLFSYKFSKEPTLLVVGNETRGIEDQYLKQLDEVIEIPLFGMPHSLNVAVATSVILFEYAKQHN